MSLNEMKTLAAIFLFPGILLFIYIAFQLCIRVLGALYKKNVKDAKVTIFEDNQSGHRKVPVEKRIICSIWMGMAGLIMAPLFYKPDDKLFLLCVCIGVFVGAFFQCRFTANEKIESWFSGMLFRSALGGTICGLIGPMIFLFIGPIFLALIEYDGENVIELAQSLLSALKEGLGSIGAIILLSPFVWTFSAPLGIVTGIITQHHWSQKNSRFLTTS